MGHIRIASLLSVMGMTVQRGEYSSRRAMAITTYLKLTEILPSGTA